MVEFAGIGGFILLALNVWAIVSIVRSRAPTGSKVLWTLFVLFLPLIGFVARFLVRPRATRASI